MVPNLVFFPFPLLSAYMIGLSLIGCSICLLDLQEGQLKSYYINQIVIQSSVIYSLSAQGFMLPLYYIHFFNTLFISHVSLAFLLSNISCIWYIVHSIRRATVIRVKKNTFYQSNLSNKSQEQQSVVSRKNRQTNIIRCFVLCTRNYLSL